MRDMYHNVLVSQHLSPIVATSAKTSTSIDLQGYNSINVIFNIGLAGDTLSGTVYWTIKLQHSDDDTTYSDLSLSDLNSPYLTIAIDSSAKEKLL